MDTGEHLAYHRLLETAQGDGCPICALIRQAESQFYDSLLYSKVANVGFLDQYAAAGGFCADHGHRLRQYNDGLAVAMLYQPLLNRLERPGAGRSPLMPGKSGAGRSIFKRRRRGSSGKPKCPACEATDNAERHYLAVLHQYRDDERMIRSFETGSGLCLPHYRMYTARHFRVPSWLRELQNRVHEGIFQALERYIQWENYSNHDRSTISDADLTSWSRVIDYVHGKVASQ